MFQDLVADAGTISPEELYERYLGELTAIVEDEGIEAVAARTDVGTEALEALATEERPELTMTEAAAILGVREGLDGETIATESRDALLMGMTNAVMDVDVLAAAVDRDLDPREIQAKVEGRFPMTLQEFALLHATIQERAP